MVKHPAASKGWLCVAVLSLTTLICLSATTLSQSGRPSTQTERADSPRIRQQQMDRREAQLRNLGAQSYRTTESSTASPVAQVKQDFQRILVIHNEFAKLLLSGEALDYKFVSERTGDIKKRATRLQSLLALGDEESEQNDETRFNTDDTNVKDSLVALCKQIESFVSNPMIENPGTVELEHMARARHDLAGIISLSASINKSAQKLSKSTKQTRPAN